MAAELRLASARVTLVMQSLLLCNHLVTQSLLKTSAHCISHERTCTYQLQSLLLLGLARAWFAMAGLIHILLIATRASAGNRAAVTALT